MDVFNLQASIELELAEFERRLNQAENDMQKFSKSAGGTFSKVGGLLKDGIVAGAKAAVAGITALTTAVTGLAVSASKSYSTFEQLSSGAQKIFDEIDYEKIARDADNAYKDLNMSANQYLESINLVGATFAQTMGDEKGYETARAGMLAISDYASGTGKSIDELNQKYQMITRATSSYQSIADQFSGILPATSADFLAQAQAAGLLSSEYEKLTQVPVAEYQQALTAMLEKGVNDLGLSQNTLRESTETMTGSLAMAKSAWENLKVAMAGGGNLDTAMQNFASSASSAIKNIIPTFQTALKGVGTLIKELAPVISKELPGLLKTLVNDVGGAVVDVLPTITAALKEALPQLIEDFGTLINTMFPAVTEAIFELALVLIESGAKLITDLANGLAEALPTLIPQIYDVILTIAEILTSPDVLPPLLEAAMAIILALAEGFVGAAPILAEKLPIIVEQIMSVLSTEAPKLVETAFLLIGTLVSGLIENAPTIFRAGVDIVVSIIEGIGSYFGNMYEKAKELIGRFLDGITEKFPNLSEKATEIYEKIKNGISNAVDKAKTWGKDLIDNFVGGIKEKIHKVTETVADVAQTVKDYIGFSEPEKGPLSNFHTYGPDLVDLFTKGIDDNQYKLINSVRGMAANVQGGLQFSGFSGIPTGTGALATTAASPSAIAPISIIFEINGIKSVNELDFNEMSSRAVDALVNQLDKHGIATNRAKGGAGWY